MIQVSGSGSKGQKEAHAKTPRPKVHLGLKHPCTLCLEPFTFHFPVPATIHPALDSSFAPQPFRKSLPLRPGSDSESLSAKRTHKEPPSKKPGLFAYRTSFLFAKRITCEIVRLGQTQRKKFHLSAILNSPLISPIGQMQKAG